MEDHRIFNIVIIDDDNINNHLSEAIIRLIFPKINVKSFLYPRAGLDYIHTQYSLPGTEKTLLLLDINMPVLTGWDVLEILNGFPDAIKDQLDIYMFTSSINVEDKQKANDNPLVLGFIEKPLDKRVLKEIIGNYTCSRIKLCIV